MLVTLSTVRKRQAYRRRRLNGARGRVYCHAAAILFAYVFQDSEELQAREVPQLQEDSEETASPLPSPTGRSLHLVQLEHQQRDRTQGTGDKVNSSPPSGNTSCDITEDQRRGRNSLSPSQGAVDTDEASLRPGEAGRRLGSGESDNRLDGPRNPHNTLGVAAAGVIGSGGGIFPEGTGPSSSGIDDDDGGDPMYLIGGREGDDGADEDGGGGGRHSVMGDGGMSLASAIKNGQHHGRESVSTGGGNEETN